MAEPAAARPPEGHERSVGDLISEAIKDLTQLVKYQTDLAKAELRADLQRAGLSGALLAIAAFTCFLVLVMLCFAYAFGLVAAGLPAWAAFLIVAGTLVLLAAICAGIVYLKVRRMTGLRQTRESVQADLAMLRRDEQAHQRPCSGDPMPVTDGSAVYIDGPWSHRSISANGSRFHIADSGDGPLVLMLHGFPQFWWAWRHQLTSLPGAGFRAVASDLRGYGGSDKPPRGYDLITAASDAAGLIRALGEANAVVVGHDWGALVAWTMATYHPKVVRRLTIVSSAHPLRMRADMLTGPVRRRWRNGSTLAFQLPVLPESRLVRENAEQVGRILRAWSGPGWPDQETENRYRAAMVIPSVAHSALEYHRWFLRSWLRADGIRYGHRMRSPIGVPTLHLHGAMDPCVPTRSAQASARYVDGPYRWRTIEGAGHFLPEEQPGKFDSALRNWLADPEPER